MVRFIFGIIFGILALIFVFQNMENTSVTFLAWSITTSRAVILLIILAAGFLVGLAVGGIRRMRKKPRR